MTGNPTRRAPTGQEASVPEHPHHDPDHHGSHFDDRAATWDGTPGKREEAAAVAGAVVDALDLRGDERLLEYGAGTGLVAAALADHVGRVTLADASAGMLAVMRAKVAEGDLPAGTRVLELDLTRDAVPSERFDVVVCSLVLHHLVEVPPVLGALHDLLAEGGHLAVLDLDTDPDGSFHAQVDDFHGHDGFDREQFSLWLADAGFERVTVVDGVAVTKPDGDYPTFLATARRA
ncbi:class I SAM-dependent DNA methyltransferase [Kytococcus schroeteri]|uniref:class I SAM-dependent DNA methyltransferase n=1 Tax=Kytococcus schroeteri TaxID=138300 RepID=UPI001EE28622|nr:class I SAM-dependent methyltransferase [Kytococcus schroeteri]